MHPMTEVFLSPHSLDFGQGATVGSFILGKKMIRDNLGRFVKNHTFLSGGEKGWYKEGMIPWIKGKKHTEKSKERMKVSRLKKLAGKKLLKNKIYKIICSDCGIERNKNRQGFLEIVRKEKSNRCFPCANKRKKLNSGNFKKGSKPKPVALFLNSHGKNLYRHKILRSAPWRRL